MSNSAKVVLYSYHRSSASWRLRIALALKEIEYEYRVVNLSTNEQQGEEFVGVNKMAQIPVLVMDGITMTQSLPIMEYLDETKQGTELLPKDPQRRYRARQIAEIVNSGIHPVQNSLRHSMKDEPDRRLSTAKNVITKGMDSIECLLQETAGQCCIGDSVSIADICLIPQVYKAFNFGVNMSEYPCIMKVYEYCQQLPQFKSALPSCQPDTPMS